MLHLLLPKVPVTGAPGLRHDGPGGGRPPQGAAQAPAQGVHGRGAAAADATDYPVLPETVHHHAPGQDGGLHGDAHRGVQEPSAGLQAQDKECCLNQVQPFCDQ